jgi:hypothetical protein
MVGHVAYALYKRDKLAFIEKIKAEKEREPTDAELSVFILASNLELRTDAYRSEAEQALQVFSQVVLTDSMADMERRFERDLASELSKSRSWPRAIAENLAANLLAVALVALLAVVIYGTRIGFIPLVADVFGHELTPKTRSAD